MRSYFTNIAKFFLLFYPRYICKREFEQPNTFTVNERPVEFRFVFEQLSKIYPKEVLDVGTGTTALPHLIRNCGFNVTATDNVKDYWPTGMFNRHYHVVNDDITNTKLDRTFDFITCVSVLEHIEDADSAIKNMFNLLNPKGYIVLTCPYNENSYSENIYDRESSLSGQNAPYVCQAFSREKLNNWLDINDGIVVEQEYWRFYEGEYWTEGGDVIPPQQSKKDHPHQITCILLQKK
jgi:2-polyprenyl-3-methyl-5-hydroxy-6-metoxy-1,4-benzoquinol methylase|tara:strand:+ start:31 stop:738 length:708 start_codon:yes stop_codon:yes gene_type:complete